MTTKTEDTLTKDDVGAAASDITQEKESTSDTMELDQDDAVAAEPDDIFVPDWEEYTSADDADTSEDEAADIKTDEGTQAMAPTTNNAMEERRSAPDSLYYTWQEFVR